MLNQVIRGSYVAFAILALSIFCLFQRLIPTYYFAAALGLWILYSAFRFAVLVAKRFSQSFDGRSDKDTLVFWLAALGSSMLAPLLWMLVVSQIKVF